MSKRPKPPEGAYTPSRKPGVRVTVPASSANLGPGFDVLGLALELVNIYDVWEMDTELRIEVIGEGAGSIPTDYDNLFYTTMNTYFTLAGYQPGGLVIREQNHIPLARGLGSSAATIVGALLAARYVSGYQMDDERLLDLAGSLEGHADNTTAAYRGGLNLVIPQTGGRHTVRRLPWPPMLGCALFIPELLVSTESAREVLPEVYPRDAVVSNLARLALFISALQESRFEDLALATEDRLHQPYRAELVPGLDSIIGSAMMAGALGAFLSGAGPAVLALYHREERGRGQGIADAMVKAGKGFGLEARGVVLDARVRGADFAALPHDPSGVPLLR